MQLQGIFIHHVFFWLQEPANEEARKELVKGLEKLSAVKTIRQFHIGIPAATTREVVQNTYSVSWAVLFDNLADEESYQVDPIHLTFIKECSHLWNKVVVYDSVDA